VGGWSPFLLTYLGDRIMPTKKKVTHTKITPAIPKAKVVRHPVFEDLKAGEKFLMGGKLYVKDNSEDQIGINLLTGEIEHELCGTEVIPVNVEIKWTKRK
jgi:hypothetical protein